MLVQEGEPAEGYEPGNRRFLGWGTRGDFGAWVMGTRKCGRRIRYSQGGTVIWALFDANHGSGRRSGVWRVAAAQDSEARIRADDAQVTAEL